MKVSKNMVFKNLKMLSFSSIEPPQLANRSAPSFFEKVNDGLLSAEGYSELSRTSELDLFMKIVNMDDSPQIIDPRIIAPNDNCPRGKFPSGKLPPPLNIKFPRK